MKASGPLQRACITILAATLIAACGSPATTRRASTHAALPRNATLVTVHTNRPGRSIPPGFLGLSLEYTAVTSYAGMDPHNLNPVFEQLVRNLAAGQAPRLRIGGDSTDWTWWPVPGMTKPPGVKTTLDTTWLQVTRALTSALKAKLILGVDLEAGSTSVAAQEATAFRHALPPGSIDALEPGNEPELYPVFGWYRNAAGQEVPGRARGYDFAAFSRDFASFAKVLPGPLAGPATGAPKWMSYLGPFLAAQPRVRLATLHRYPLQECYVAKSEPKYPSFDHLLSQGASAGLAESVAAYARIAHRRHLPLRIDEMNTISCGGGAVGQAFASALWASDALFEMARVGVDGVNIHSFPGAIYELFRFKRSPRGSWTGSVAPEYYGLLLFARAAPPGSRLLPIQTSRGARTKAWATSAPDGHIRVLLLNQSKRADTVAVNLPGGDRAAALERLRAPSLEATGGVTLAGQRVQPASGNLVGPHQATSLTPTSGAYVIALPAASAALLTI